MPKKKRPRDDRQTDGKGTTQKRPRLKVSDTSAFRKRVKTVSEFNSTVLQCKIPPTPEKERKPDAQRARYKTEQVIRQSLLARDVIAGPSTKVINKKLCDKCKIKYVTEAVAQIIVAKNIKKIDIPTPFGECTLQCVSTNNYVAKLGFTSLKYKVLLGAIDRFEKKGMLIKKIQEFLIYKIDDKFNIDTTKDVSEDIKCTLEGCIKGSAISGLEEYVTYPKGYKSKKIRRITYKNAAAVMCGIFIVEMIRSAGKIVRSAFVHGGWPASIGDLKKRFIQANPGGCKRFREYVVRDSKYDADLKAGEENARCMSPIDDN